MAQMSLDRLEQGGQDPASLRGPAGAGGSRTDSPYDPYGPYSGASPVDQALNEAGQELGRAVLGAAFKLAGRAMRARMEQKLGQRDPAIAEQARARLREQIAIAQRHPDLRACLDENVIFLAGGRQVLPMPDLNSITVNQADLLVEQLRHG